MDFPFLFQPAFDCSASGASACCGSSIASSGGSSTNSKAGLVAAAQLPDDIHSIHVHILVVQVPVPLPQRMSTVFERQDAVAVGRLSEG